MQVYDRANELAHEIRESEPCRRLRALKAEAEQDPTSAALLKEYRRLQLHLQLQAAAGADAVQEDVQRFSQMSALLYGNSVTQQLLLAEMQVQQLMADVYKLLSDASGLDIPLQ